MIKKLKRKFTVLATVSMFLLMMTLVLIMNIVNYSSVVRESDAVLNIISNSGDSLTDNSSPPAKPTEQDFGFLPKREMSPEVPYESRYFTVAVNEKGEIEEQDLSKIISVNSDSVSEYINKAIKSSGKNGLIGQFRFLKITKGDVTKIVFLDCGRKLDTFFTFLWTSLTVGFAGCIIVFVLFLFISGKIVRPIAESYEKQKRFISDAGHEIKTPLTIINANVDLLEFDGEKEELNEIKNQTHRLTELTNGLVYLSKMEESGENLPRVEMPLSDIVSEEAESFRALALVKNIAFNVYAQPQINFFGVPEAMRRLVCIITENAVKYTENGGIINIKLEKIKNK